MTMKVLASFISFMALASLSLAQQPVASPDIPPPTVTTTCGKKTLACYTSQQSNIDSVMKTFDFINGCDVFGGVISCMQNELNGGDCGQTTQNNEASDVRAWAKDDIGGICDESGTVTDCGTLIKGCFDDMQMALTDLKSANAMTACPLIPKFTACADNVRSKATCTGKALETLNTVQSALAEDALLANCDGPCAQQIGVCTENSTSYSLSALGIDKYCQDAVKVVGCIKNLETSPQCKDNAAEVDQLEKVIATQENLASDVCDHGQPSECATQVEVCYENILKLEQNPDLSVTEQCQDASLFLECMSRIPCSSALKSRLNSATGAMQTLEIQQNCPFVGSCNDRLRTCDKVEKDLEAADKKADPNGYCSTVKQGKTCFDSVRNDKTCNDENSVASDFELMIQKELGGTCGSGGGAGIIQVSVLLLMISLIAGLRNYF